MKLFMIALAAIGLSSVAVSQQTATITATLDNSIYSESGTLSNGAGAYLFSGRTNSGNVRRSLIQFNLSEVIPSNAVVSSAKVKMRVSKVPSEPATASFSLRKVTSAWGEGTSDGGANEGGGGTATTNDATWTFRFFNTSSWTNAGGDFSSTVSASTTIAGIGAIEWASTSGLVADVQSWIANPSQNFGWIISGGETSNKSAKRFDSRSSITAANRPQLVIEYSVPTSVQGNAPVPEQFALHQNYPNPFNPSTTIKFSLPQAGMTTLTVFDVLGNKVGTILSGHHEAGTHLVTFNAGTLASGVYMYTLQSGAFSQTKKFLLMK